MIENLAKPSVTKSSRVSKNARGAALVNAHPSSANAIKNLIGCHVSIAGGLFNAPSNAADLECETFQIFTRSPHGGPVKEIDESMIDKFKAEMKKYSFNNFVIHAPYFINLGSGNTRIFNGSVEVLKQELFRGSQLGASYVMFHPGSFKDLGEENGMTQAQLALEKILEGYHGSTKLLVEIAAGSGSVIGDNFEEVATLIKPIKKNKKFGGICFDTQHAFGSGYDIRTKQTQEKVFAEFDKFIGLKYIAMIHANDSKVDLGSRRDRHEHIGEGQIGDKGFGAIFDFLKSHNLDIPLILETQHDKVAIDIKKLKALRAKAWK